MEQKVLEFIRKNNIIENGENILVGVSGGADSVCLLLVLKNLMEILHIKLFVLHVHHGLRGREADEDEAFVKKLCEQWNIVCATKYVNVNEFVSQNKSSVEEAARILRYEALRDFAKQNKCKKIAVAHHGDDQAETILFQMFRGSGLKGISGMSALKGDIIRPLLCVGREEIENYLQEKGVTYCTDTTNLVTDYSRNKIRLQLLPFIKENINSQVIAHLNGLAKDAQMADEFFEKEAKRLFAEYAVFVNDEVSLDIQVFDREEIIVSYVVRMCIEQIKETLKDIGRKHISSICQLARSDGNGEIILPYGICVRKEYSKLIFYDKFLSAKKDTHINIEEIFINQAELEASFLKNDSIMLDILGYNITLRVKKVEKNQIYEKNIYTKCLDYDKIKNVLSFRKRKTGDYIVVNKSGGRKKLKDYMIDEKIPRQERDKVLLVMDGASVVWVIGYRISEQYKITENTTRILEISVNGG